MTGLPSRVVALVEPQPSHRKFVEAVEPPAVLLKVNHVRQLVRRGETSASYFETDPLVITTSTINDTQLSLISHEKEFELVAEFGTDIHIPTDYSVYREETHAERVAAVQKSLAGVTDAVEYFEGKEVDILPLLKGLYEAERQYCYEAFTDLGIETAAFYCTQYFTGAGNRIGDLESDLEQIRVETNSTLDLFLIGLLSPGYLSRLPDIVVGAAGMNQWRSSVSPTKDSAADMRASFQKLSEAVENAITSQSEKADY